ncbi:hypothetical protein [Desulfatibacillum aliphaticivorans]|uniref:hypothetical protein n=1 Tax=Desulfatibacillum aliphaticivorans TaxID=218208 RepID=UPI000480B33D|nr:hypothetical protein [Desulfatibacillum aliphaticivorans]
MKEETVNEIIDCLPKGRTPFYYFRDRYALMMLSYFVGDGKRVQEIKKSPLGRLMNKPIVKNAAKNAGSGLLTKGALDSVWPMTPECYLLTLGKWGKNDRWNTWCDQTSRRGTNLVLQLNFSGRHNQPFKRIFDAKYGSPFECCGHPNAGKGRNTLAWARIDLDLDTDEALIEEVQSDWVKMALNGKENADRITKDPSDKPNIHRYFEHVGCSPEELRTYVDGILKPHMKIWDEAMLSAAVWFLKEEIGIRKIFFHTFDSGCNLKGFIFGKPPRSLYTKLPEKFCFTKTRDYPQFLERKSNRRVKGILKSKDLRFFHLDF